MLCRKLLAIGVGAAVAVTVAACGNSTPGSTTNSSGQPVITIMVGGLDKQIYLPAQLTAQLGYFQQQGLEVHLVDEPAGVNAEDDMIAGKIDAVVGFYDHNVDL